MVRVSWFEVRGSWFVVRGPRTTFGLISSTRVRRQIVCESFAIWSQLPIFVQLSADSITELEVHISFYFMHVVLLTSACILRALRCSILLIDLLFSSCFSDSGNLEDWRIISSPVHLAALKNWGLVVVPYFRQPQYSPKFLIIIH